MTSSLEMCGEALYIPTRSPRQIHTNSFRTSFRRRRVAPERLQRKRERRERESEKERERNLCLEQSMLVCHAYHDVR